MVNVPKSLYARLTVGKKNAAYTRVFSKPP